MNKENYKIKHLLWGSLLLWIVSGCSQDIDSESQYTSQQVRLASVNLQEENDTKLVTPPDGTYYLYYGNTEPLEKTLNEGIFDGFGKTSIDWTGSNDQKQKGFILSNSKEISAPQNNQLDILWGKIAPATSNELKFILNHRMAKVHINLTLPNEWSIKSILLKNLRNEYTYSTDQGAITVNQNQTLTELTIPNDNCNLLLPPQERQSTSELYVTVNDGAADRSYHHVLPYSMRKEVSSGQWIDVPLSFIAGHLLELNARIEDNPSYTIYFTYATLTDWNKVYDGTISSRPEGIYSINDITGWIKAWNASDDIRLKKYGKKENDKWIFTLRRDINITTGDLTNLKFSSSDFTLEVENDKDYKIIGIIPNDLGLDNTTYKNIIVKTKGGNQP